MNRKNGNIIWVLAGGYLVYTGGKLITEVINAKPNLYQLMIFFGIVFVVFGGGLAFINIKGFLKTSGDSGAGRGEENEDTTETEIKDSVRKDVTIIDMKEETEEAAQTKENTGRHKDTVLQEDTEIREETEVPSEEETVKTDERLTKNDK